MVASKDQISCDLAGEAPVLELKCGTYFGPDEVGGAVWNPYGTTAPRQRKSAPHCSSGTTSKPSDAAGVRGLLGALHERGLIKAAEGRTSNETDS